MKVGIMSMQRICNYGSFLQAYCLKKLIESLGHEVEYVDYTPQKPILNNDYNRASYYRSLVREWIMNMAVHLEPICFFAPDNIRRSLRFKRDYQKKYLPLLGVSGKKSCRKKVDTLVIGSDEVFNCFQKNPQVGFSRELFGAGHNSNRLISYAASFGNSTMDEIDQAGLRAELSGLFKDFHAISVRDANSAEIIYALTGTEPAIHMDPVLMYDFMDEIPSVCDLTGYMVVYAYRGRLTEEEILSIQAFAKEKGLKTVAVGGVQPFCDVCVEGSPFEILDYIRNAEYVVTDTFHGTIFSVITHRKFACFVRGGHGKVYGNQEKLVDLVMRLGLKDRAITDCNELKAVIEQPIDYDAVDAIIVQQRRYTMAYLKDAL